MMPTARVFVITALFGLIPLQNALAAGSAYKWVDADGEIHYSQTPPPATEVELIRTPTGSALTPTPSPAPADTRSETAAGSASESAKAEDAAIRARNCTTARNNLELLKTDGEVTIKDANGLLHTLTADERSARIKKDELTVKEYCKD